MRKKQVKHFSHKKHSIQELEYLRKAADCYRDMVIAYAQMSLAFFNRYNFIEKKFRSVESALDRENKPVKISTDVLEVALEMCGISMKVHDYLKVLEPLEVDIEYYKEDLISNIKQLRQSAKTMTWDSLLKQSNINILDITKKIS